MKMLPVINPLVGSWILSFRQCSTLYRQCCHPSLAIHHGTARIDYHVAFQYSIHQRTCLAIKELPKTYILSVTRDERSPIVTLQLHEEERPKEQELLRDVVKE